MGTKHYRGVYACGLYCNQNLEPGQDGTTFELKSVNQHWCRCPVCTLVRDAHEREMKKRWDKKHPKLTMQQRRSRKTDEQREADLVLGKRHNKDGWKRCNRCGVLTPNYYGLCRACREHLGDICDIDAIVTWNSGPAIHRRRMGTVCRVGAKTF